MNIVVLVVVGLIALAGLVAIGMTYGRWHVTTLVASLLLLCSVVGFVYLAARLAARDHAWQEALRRYEKDLVRVRDAREEGPDGTVQDQPGQLSLTALATERNRWKRALERVETWHGRIWKKASFRPPQGPGQPGEVQLVALPPAADGAAPVAGAAPPAPPLNAGARVFLFDAAEQSRYLGEYVVTEARLDPATNRFILAVDLAAELDAYDSLILGRTYDDVEVFESLPSDRWLAFHATPVTPGGTEPLPPPAKRGIEEVERMLDLAANRLQEDLHRHEQPVPNEEWAAVEEQVRSGTALPGTYWAHVTFTSDYAFAETGTSSPNTKREYASGESADLDLHTVLEPGVKAAVTIDSIFFRRPLVDPLTVLHGSQAKAGGGGVRAEGIDSRRRTLRREMADLEAARERLATTLRQALDHIAQSQDVRGQLEQDLQSWQRDAAAAARIASDFEGERDRVRNTLSAAEREIVRLGGDLRETVGRLAAGIDAIAPPPAAARRVDVR